MKLKPSEIAFTVICIAAALIVAVSVYVVRQRSSEGGVTVSRAETDESEEYDVSVINAASMEDFMQVSGIGEVKAGNIIAYREALGGFDKVSRLLDVSGISDTLYQKIIDYFYMSQDSADSSDSADYDVTASPEPLNTSLPETANTPADTKAPAAEPDKKESEKTEEKATAPQATEPAVAETAPTTERVMREVDINSASAEEIADALMIDESLAEEIVALRETIHGFSTVQELDLCSGMTAEIYRRIKGYVKIN